MKSYLFAGTVALVSLLALNTTRADSLDARINAILTNTQLKNAQVSMDVQEITPKGSVAVFSHNPTLALGPASNCKLLTTAAALEKYGPSAAFKTFLYQVGPDLLLVGGGDPGFGDVKIATRHNESATTVFEQWAGKLKAAGITSYRDLIVDDRVFDSQWTNPNWPAHDELSSDSAPIAGLNFNANCLDWTPTLSGNSVSVQLMPQTTYVTVVTKATRGKENRVSMIRPPTSNAFEFRGTVSATASSANSVPIYDPSLWTGTVFRDILTRAGVSQQRDIRRPAPDETFGKGNLVATHETAILDVIERANTNSLNMMAECLCKRLGYDATGKPGSWANGTAAVENFVQSLGAKPDWISLDDGSGLSNKNKAAARVFTLVLTHMAQRPDGGMFMETLATPEEDGTLKTQKRFVGLKVAPRIRAKTGHIAAVSTLSGYIFTESRTFVFSILCNKYEGNVNPLQDQMCEAIYDWATGK